MHASPVIKEPPLFFDNEDDHRKPEVDTMRKLTTDNEQPCPNR